MARVGRRIGALFIDWIIASVIAAIIDSAVLGGLNSTTYAQPRHQSMVYLVWVLLMIVEVPILGGTIGHRTLGMAVAPVKGGWPGVWRPLVRAVLLALVIPALVWDSDQRGFHDKIAGTVLVRA